MSLVCQDTSNVPKAPILWGPAPPQSSTMIRWISCKCSLNPCLLQLCLLLVGGSQTLLREFSLVITKMGPSAHSSGTWTVATAQEDTAYLPSCSGRLHMHLAYHKSEIKMYLLKSFSLRLTQIRLNLVFGHSALACLSLQLRAGCAWRSTNPRFKPRWWWWLPKAMMFYQHRTQDLHRADSKTKVCILYQAYRHGIWSVLSPISHHLPL